MLLRYFVCSFHFFVFSQAQRNDIIRDYFVYKNVSRVVGFSCGDSEDDFQMTKMLNDIGIMSQIKSIRSDIDIVKFIHTSYWNLGVFLDSRCSEQSTIRIFDEVSAYRMYNDLHNWYILGRNMSHTMKMINDSAFSFVTDFVICVPSGDHYDLYDIYNHCKYRNGSLNVTKLGTWQKDNGLKITLLEEKATRRRDFHGMKIKVSGFVFHKPKRMDVVKYLERKENKEIWTKFGYAITSIFTNIYNITMDVQAVTKWTNTNDLIGPLLRKLHTSEVDVVYYPSVPTKERIEHAQLAIQVWPVRLSFLFRAFPSKKIKMGVLLRPFASDTWYMIILSTFIVTGFLALILKLESSDNENNYGNSVFSIIAILCQQGITPSPKRLAGRIVFLQTLIFSLLLYNSYSAAIVSARLNEPLYRINDSLRELVDSKMKLGARIQDETIYFPVLLDLFTVSDAQYFRDHWRKIPISEKIFDLEEGVRRLSMGGFAYHTDPNEAYPFINRYFTNEMTCQLSEIHAIPFSNVPIFTSYNRQFHEITKIGLIKVQDMGLRQRQIQQWFSKKPYCDKRETFVSSVTIQDVAYILLLLLCGTIVSVIICLLEIISFNQFQSKQTRIFVKNKWSLSKTANGKILISAHR